MLKDIRGFIGFSNFYRRFIKDFSAIAVLYMTSQRKMSLVHWGTRSSKLAFVTAKRSVL